MDDGPESIEDATECRAVRRQGRAVHLAAFLAAVAATAAAVALPSHG